MKRKDIRNIVKLAIDNIIVEGCTDVSTFGRPFELNLLKNQYPIIKKMSKNEIYADLLKTPFYINIIIKEAIDIDKITDINKFRDYIWNNIICLKDKHKKYKEKYEWEWQ